MSGMPLTVRGNKHLIIMFDDTYEVILVGGIKERTDYEIARWLYDHFFHKNKTNVFNAPTERWGVGILSELLKTKTIKRIK